eukprot:CAMPEP_0198364718 /NCGR_PEP_ID=MMETSP1450-20131203/153807_1 /TAXON_ID=753684 ORGANISM="Madagascaria erythrocladiodes, Strain CCMP3234" /NCGR_SAMPLE_ID=MMETSP1450 /ASSEMBLY_ACC=CAM_ASM_001115 /LENGTH=362 /DNA_ID=CAMNT_0044072157 /DNA_START=611 /DNA_END=1699 /DNA_ORIENTATION=-
MTFLFRRGRNPQPRDIRDVFAPDFFDESVVAPSIDSVSVQSPSGTSQQSSAMDVDKEYTLPVKATSNSSSFTSNYSNVTPPRRAVSSAVAVEPIAGSSGSIRRSKTRPDQRRPSSSFANPGANSRKGVSGRISMTFGKQQPAAKTNSYAKRGFSGRLSGHLSGGLTRMSGRLTARRASRMARRAAEPQQDVWDSDVTPDNGSESSLEGTAPSKLNGLGTMRLADGSHYMGQLQDGMMHGVGTLTCSTGLVYKGDFERGMKCGRGMTTFTDGRKHIGSYEDNEIHGHGSLHFADGSRYSGAFANGKAHGPGRQDGGQGSSWEFKGYFDCGVKISGKYYLWNGQVLDALPEGLLKERPMVLLAA